ncbi:UbiD family decarboxylase [Drechmeria coniospora]|uniref:UbiD family decarboxylase n=1 Tax=Drechmeria coniospora TaxID=98403 RepID=A0A151GNT2_DRECN|nr:UbiD family decarboxylase [Drechmeria coniospora]KYK58774.1 UbiD family decarboxylase [Drechmeria coniospora]
MELTTSLAVESWILYVVGVVVVVARLVSRSIKLGKWSRLQLDDYLIVFALVNFTGVVVSINEVAKNGSNYMDADAAAALDDHGVQRAVYGSIMTFVLEVFTLTAIWTVKACLLLLYARLTRNTLPKQHLLVKMVAWYCALTYLVAMFMFIFFWCHPTVEYWAVPVRNRRQHAAPRRRPWPADEDRAMRDILAAILNRYCNFSSPNSYVFLFWYVAEVGVAMMVGNLPLCWPIVRLMMGSREATQTPSYQIETIGGEGRKNRRAKPLAAARASIMSIEWGKLDDQECGPTAREAPHSHHAASEQGSQIELVLREHDLSLHDDDAVAAGEEKETASERRVILTGSAEPKGDMDSAMKPVDVISDSQLDR